LTKFLSVRVAVAATVPPLAVRAGALSAGPS
jgi:hypothetical protein